MMLYHSSLLVLMFLSFVLQEYIPPITWIHEARLCLAPIFFFASSVTVSYPFMLFLALCYGFLWDARYVVSGSTPDYAFGYTILLFGVLGSMMQGIRPLFSRGRYELPVLMTGLATTLLLLFQYLLINFKRGGFYFTMDIWYRIAISSLLAIIVAPVIYLILVLIGKICRYEFRYEGLSYR